MTYLLHAGQAELSKLYEASNARKFVVCCARRYGKSYWCCVLAISYAIRHPGAQIRYAAPTGLMVRKIITPIMRQLLEDCPDALRPKFMSQDGVWLFPNGSELHIAGCDNGGAERLRGTGTHLGIVDEAGFITDAYYVVQSILLPQTMKTGGRILITSTPPKTPAHDFTKFSLDAEARGDYVRRTIWDAVKVGHITREIAEEFIEEGGGVESSTVRREYLCEFVIDEARAIVPEFTRNETSVVCAVERPRWFDTYTVADTAYNDLFVALFAYYHFPLARVVIEDELVFHNESSAVIAPAILAKEQELWGAPPFLRVADAPLQQLCDMTTDHGLSFTAAHKDDKDSAINALRQACRKASVAIHPRCKTTIAHLRGGVWNKARTTFERSGEFGHFDAVDAAVYLERHVAKHRNPFPRLAPGVTASDYHIRPHTNDPDGTEAALKTAFTRKRARYG